MHFIYKELSFVNNCAGVVVRASVILKMTSGDQVVETSVPSSPGRSHKTNY